MIFFLQNDVDVERKTKGKELYVAHFMLRMRFFTSTKTGRNLLGETTVSI